MASLDRLVLSDLPKLGSNTGLSDKDIVSATGRASAIAGLSTMLKLSKRSLANAYVKTSDIVAMLFLKASTSVGKWV